ncbi:MAG: sugar transferase [Deltaproteobacteria bacterium]|nr:sugar transferase [Deltaproteobacteria bacterium]
MAELLVDFHFYPEEHDNITAKSNHFEKILYPDIHLDNQTRRYGFFFKRAIDIIGSSLALLLLSPVLCFISLLILATSKGPVLFRQERLGQFGKKFIFLKFRSMHVNSDDAIHREYVKKLITENTASEENSNGAQGPVYKIRNDPRITPVGEFLRKTSLDELPQLLNVLRGEMSLVGPRPPIQYEFENYDIWHRYRLLKVKPGITGLWQVTGRSSTTFDDMVRLDLKYIQEWSLWLDFKILLLTPLAVIKGKGAY